MCASATLMYKASHTVCGSTFQGGALKYSGYDYTIDGETMYVSIKNRLFIGKTGDFSLKIKDDKLQKVKKVYLQGEDQSDTYQLWPYLEE